MFHFWNKILLELGITALDSYRQPGSRVYLNSFTRFCWFACAIFLYQVINIFLFYKKCKSAEMRWMFSAFLTKPFTNINSNQMQRFLWIISDVLGTNFRKTFPLFHYNPPPPPHKLNGHFSVTPNLILLNDNGGGSTFVVGVTGKSIVFRLCFPQFSGCILFDPPPPPYARTILLHYKSLWNATCSVTGGGGGGLITYWGKEEGTNGKNPEIN